MGNLYKGVWTQAPMATLDQEGHFVRLDSAFRNKVTQDGSSGFKAEPNRYHLYIGYPCPWASRTLMVRALKGLKDVISFSAAKPLMLENGWEFGEAGSKTEDTVNHADYLYQIYQKADSKYTGKATVPVLWDKINQTIVSNESSEIIIMLNSEFNKFSKNSDDFYPENLKAEIDRINEFVYHNINNGVYKCGFSNTQKAYEEELIALFSALDKIEERLSQQRYLVGNKITLADIRLFTTLVRFDPVYLGHFKCNLKRIADYPNLSNYLRELYQIPEIKETVKLEQIKKHYYGSQLFINPSGIVAKGPKLNYDEPHNRDRFK